jgi:short-subunit dehydrogenase involved in D-alanine esterification of teichoic acids
MLRIWQVDTCPHFVLFSPTMSHMIPISEAFKETIKKFGDLDIVVNNAGLCNEKNWKYVVSVNLVSRKIKLHI